MPFWPQCCDSEAILSKSFVPVTRAGVFIRENFHPGYRDLGNRVSTASHMNTSKVLRRKEWRGEISETKPARLTGALSGQKSDSRTIVSILQSFSHCLNAKYINCLKLHRKQFPMGTREDKFQRSEILCKHRQNFIISFISPERSSVSYEVQHSFSTFGVARIDVF